MHRHEWSDPEWERIKDWFPVVKGPGRPPADRRLMVNAALWIARTGAPWRDLPERFGPWQSA
jgi:transposase